MAEGGTLAKPNIKGGDYRAIDTGDGWYILRDIPTLAPVKKGEKNAPEDIGEDWFNSALKFGQDSYEQGKIAYPVHLTHTDDLGLHNPEFAGYFKPSKIGRMTLPEKGEVPVVFSDYKIKANVFQKMAKGELGYLSPEVRNWNKKRISSVALLDSVPPHNPFPLLTIGEVVSDPTAQFQADLPKGASVAKFEDGKERVKFDDFDPMDTASQQLPAKPEGEMKGGHCCEHCPGMRGEIEKISGSLYGGKMQDGKPDGKPVEQPSAQPTPQGSSAHTRMEDDPKAMARFAALEDKNAALAKRLDERDAQEKASALAAKALDELKGYQIGEQTKAQIARFAAEGEEKLKSFLAAVKEIAVKDSPRSLFDAELAGAVKMNDPVVAKFSANSPDKAEKVARFATEYRALRGSAAGRGMRLTEEQYVEMALKDSENGGNV